MCTTCKKSFFKRTKKPKSRISPKLTKSTELMEIKPIKQSKFLCNNLPKKPLEKPQITERIKESQLKEQLKETQIKESQLKAQLKEAHDRESQLKTQLKEAHDRESQFNEKLKEFRLSEKIRDAKFKETLREAIKEKIGELVDKPLKRTLNNYEIKDTVCRVEAIGVPVVSLKHPATVAPVCRDETISNSDTDDDFSNINETSKNLRDVGIDIVDNASEMDDDWDNISNISYDDCLNAINESAKNNEKC